ncbi:MAG: hypothetical protein WC655_18340 [Candidatus Hydrogenedentales bacterium]|jgi:hypothetical protein
MLRGIICSLVMIIAWTNPIIAGFSLAQAADAGQMEAPPNPKLVKLPFSFPAGMENTPVTYRGRPLLVQNRRSNKNGPEQDDADLFIQDLVTGQEVARLGKGFSFVSALVNGDEMNVFGTVNTSKEWTKDVYRFWSTDLENWKRELAVARKDADEHLFNTSVCRDGQGYLMAYESNKPLAWSFYFARSKDLAKWEKIPDLAFADTTENSFCACPALRYFAPYYYAIYGIQCDQGIGKHYQYQLPTSKYAAAVARSKDLVTWDLSPCRGPFLDPVPGEGINNTDVDLFEYEGNTYVYYGTGDQATWGTIRVAMYAGPMKEMLEAHFPADAPTIQFDTKQRKYIYP